MKTLTAQERHEILIRQGWEYVLNTEEGRALVYDLIGMCGVYRSDVIQDGLIQFEAGKRNIGLKILAEALATDSESYLKMIQEHVNRDKEIDHESKNAINSGE